MIVVADASPLNYLVQLGLAEATLRALYKTVLIPDAVRAELLDGATPTLVRQWAMELPTWIVVQNPLQARRQEVLLLDEGEAAALTLALEVKADVVLIDELRGRRTASQQLGLTVTGTLGILRDAHQLGFIDARQALVTFCSTTNFRYDERLLSEVTSQLIELHP